MIKAHIFTRFYLFCVYMLLPLSSFSARPDHHTPQHTATLTWQHAATIHSNLKNLITTLEQSQAFSSDDAVIKKLTLIIDALKKIDQQLHKAKHGDETDKTMSNRPDSLREIYTRLISLLDEQQSTTRSHDHRTEENGPYQVTNSMRIFIRDNSDIIAPEITATTFVLAIVFKTVVQLGIALGYGHLTRDAFCALPLKEQSLTEENAKKIHKSLLVPRLLLMIPSTLLHYAINQTFKNRGAKSIYKVIEVIAVRITSYLATLIFLHKHYALLQHPSTLSLLFDVAKTLITARFFAKPTTKVFKTLLNTTAFASYFCFPGRMSLLERCLDGCAHLCVHELPEMIINKIALPTMFVGKNRKRVIMDTIQLLLDASKQFVIERSL